MSEKETQIEELVNDILSKYADDYELVDVEYVKERDWYLRVYIDKAGGVNLDDCQKISDELGKILDEKNIIPNAYILEVSSPGLDRQLKKPRDFIRERGKIVDVSLFVANNDNQKIVVGELENFDGEFLTLKDNQPIPFEKVASVRLHIDF